MASITRFRTPVARRVWRKRLERLLERQQATLEVGRGDLRNSGRSDSAAVRDSEEESVDGVRAGVNTAVLELGWRAAWDLESALWRLDAGTFGRCADCGGRIPVRRLSAVSFAERCRDCQEVQDLVTTAH